MSRTVWASLGLALLLAGCGGAGPQGVLSAPHNGLIVSVPGGKAYVEVVKLSTAGEPMRVGFYFLTLGRRPLDPAPTTATLKVQGLRDPKPLDLKANGDGGLETPPIPNVAELEGNLMFTLDGQSVTVPINVR